MPPAGQTRVELRIQETHYAVHIGPGLLADLGRLTAAALRRSGGRAMLVIDAALPETLTTTAIESLGASGFAASRTAIPASETEKTLARLEALVRAIAAAKLDRRDPVIALGGGVVGDLAGFAAAVYRRGVPLVQCPTTLLSMVDAGVGGKTGVNLEISPNDLRKNMVGSFHQPSLVIADLDTLKSLPPRQFRSGLGECVKHALIGADARDPNLAEWLAARADAIVAHDAATLTELIARNVSAKASIVEADPLERAPSAAGGRALLNLGHTFAHAIETIPALSLHHGEAVALGLVAASAAAGEMGLVGPDHVSWVRSILVRFGLPIAAGMLPDSASLIARMHDDKKVLSGVLRVVLPRGRWHARVIENPPTAALEAGWAAIRG